MPLNAIIAKAESHMKTVTRISNTLSVEKSLASTDAPRLISNPPVKGKQDTREDARLQLDASSQPAKCMVTTCVKYIVVRRITVTNLRCQLSALLCYSRAPC